MAARTYLEIKRRGTIQNFALAARYSSLVRGDKLAGTIVTMAAARNILVIVGGTKAGAGQNDH